MDPGLQIIEDRIVAAAEKYRKLGYQIIARDYGRWDYSQDPVRLTCLCPVACLTGNPQSKTADDAAAAGCTVFQLWDIIFGIDGSAAVATDPEFFQLGARVAKRLGLEPKRA